MDTVELGCSSRAVAEGVGVGLVTTGPGRAAHISGRNKKIVLSGFIARCVLC